MPLAPQHAASRQRPNSGSSLAGGLPSSKSVPMRAAVTRVWVLRTCTCDQAMTSCLVGDSATQARWRLSRSQTCINMYQAVQACSGTGFLGPGPSSVMRVLLPQRIHSTVNGGAGVSPSARGMRFACPPRPVEFPRAYHELSYLICVNLSPPFARLRGCALCRGRDHSEKAKVCASAEACLMGYIVFWVRQWSGKGICARHFLRVPCCLPSPAVRALQRIHLTLAVSWRVWLPAMASGCTSSIDVVEVANSSEIVLTGTIEAHIVG